MEQVKTQNSNGIDHTRYAAIYGRVSTDEQRENYSIPTQKEACMKLAAREGYMVPESHILTDEGISGTTLDRPALRRLRDLMRTGAISAVIVLDPDRLCRNLGHQLLLAEEMEQAGVKLVVVSHPLEQGPEGWLFFQMRGALAEYERAKFLERSRRGTVGRIQAGHPWGGRVPLGYRYISEPHGGRFEIEEEEAALVRRIYGMCLGGMATRAIARQLTAERVPTPLDRRPINRAWRKLPPGTWNENTVRYILTSEAYAGRAAWGKTQNLPHTTRRRRRPQNEWVALAIPPIIDGAAFQAAKAALKRHKDLAKRNRKHDYLFVGGRLRCGRCGRGVTGICYKPGILYYRCNTHYHVMPSDQRCRGSLRADEVESYVWKAVAQFLEDPEVVAAEVARQHATADEQRAVVQQELMLIETALAKCDREAQRWADAYAQEVIDVAELKAYRSEIETRRQGLLTEHTSYQAKLDAIGQANQQVEVLTDYCARVRQKLHALNKAEKRVAFEALDIKVSWTPGTPPMISGSIPLPEIVQSSARWCSPLGRLGGTPSPERSAGTFASRPATPSSVSRGSSRPRAPPWRTC
jgi:site-specific DNA recombinase